MKKIVILFLFVSPSIFCATSFSQPNMELMRGKLPDIFIPDSYPLLDGKDIIVQSEDMKNLILHTYTDPGIALPPMNWDCDPGILLMPKFKNCDPGMVYWEKDNSGNRIPTFKQFTPPSLQPNSFITPFLLPGENPLFKQEELQKAGKLFMLNNEFQKSPLFENDARTPH